MTIPKKYIPDTLSQADKIKQKKSILNKTNRPKVNYRPRRSQWTIRAYKYFNDKQPTLEMLSKASGVPQSALKQIIKRGEGAYYSSGSRPNVSAKQWGLARLYAVLFGSVGARIADRDLISKYKIPSLV